MDPRYVGLPHGSLPEASPSENLCGAGFELNSLEILGFQSLLHLVQVELALVGQAELDFFCGNVGHNGLLLYPR